MDNEIYERLNSVFREFFDDEEIELDADTTADDIEDWPLRFWEQVLEKSQKGRTLKRDVDGSTDSSWVSRRGEEWIG